MLRGKGRDLHLFVLINDSRFDFVRVHLPPFGEAALVSFGIGARLDVDAVSLQNMFGHRLQTAWAVNLKRDCPARCPSTEDKVRVASSVIGMKMRHECHLEIARFNCWNFSFEGRGLGAAHNAWSEIDEVSTIINNY